MSSARMKRMLGGTTDEGWPTELTDDTEKRRGMRRLRRCFIFRVFSVFRGLLLMDKAFDDDTAFGSEVDEEAEFHAGGFEVIEDLRAMLVGEIRHGFEFENDLVVANHIRDEGVAQLGPL